MWQWLRRNRPEPPLSDADFNDYLDHLLSATRDLLAKPTTDYFPNVWELRSKSIHIDVLCPDDNSEMDDFDAFTFQFGQQLARKRRTLPQAIFLAYLAETEEEDGLLAIVFHGATADRRAHRAVLFVRRDENGHLIPADGDADVQRHPVDPANPLKFNYARRILDAFP